MIIVTATGGGLHASAWTAAVLAGRSDLDQASPGQLSPFAAARQHGLRRQRSLSSPGNPAGLGSGLHPNANRGAVSYKPGGGRLGPRLLRFPKAFVPLFPYSSLPSSGDMDLDKSPLFKDRTWSLRKAFARNAFNDFCVDTWHRDRGEPVPSGFRKLLASSLKYQSDADQLKKSSPWSLPPQKQFFPASAAEHHQLRGRAAILAGQLQIRIPTPPRIGRNPAQLQSPVLSGNLQHRPRQGGD